MQNTHKNGFFLHILVLLSGCAALSWEVLWQVKSSLALGYSAWGTAITLAVTMGGMSAGALAMGRSLRNRNTLRPVRLYGILEIIVGLCGLLLGTAFTALENLDTIVYAASPAAAPLVHIAGIIAILGLPAMCLGATLPVIGIAGQKYRTSIAILYGLNTLGAAAGTMIAGFVLIPSFGLAGTAILIAIINLAVGLFAIMQDREDYAVPVQETKSDTVSLFTWRTACLIAAVTGFATFALEVAWFRSLVSAFHSTTDAFAIMLACVLIALGFSARITPWLKKHNASLPAILAWSGILIIAITPVIERFDMIYLPRTDFPLALIGRWFFMTLFTVGAPVLLLGTALPWLLDDRKTPREWGRLYGLNALSAILGSLCAGWVLLPTIGFAKTAWIAGALVAATGLLLLQGKQRNIYGACAVAALIAAITLESGVGTSRVQAGMLPDTIKPKTVLKSYEGPDATISVAKAPSGSRMLIINGFVTTLQLENIAGRLDPVHYMPWMGHMPMLLHPNPENALIICFGTGQTAHAVRVENPTNIDIVDLNKHVFDMAPYFDKNQNVLGDDRVNAIVMDGRAWIRRTNKTYDVITLEPMPPNFAGVNALYAKEFYEEAYQKLSPDGIIAQWVPFQLVPAYYSASIARTFQSVFKNAIMWIDPLSGTGILLGSKNDYVQLGQTLPGYRRGGIERDMTEAEVRSAIALSPQELQQYGAAGELITDNNQLLAYGRAVYDSHRSTSELAHENMELIKNVTGHEYPEIIGQIK